MTVNSAKKVRSAVVERRPPAAILRAVAPKHTPPAQQLQRRVGNQGARAIIARAVQARSESVAQRASAASQSRASLPVSSPKDPAEREAVSKATQVMRMSEPASSVRLASPAVVSRVHVQRDAATPSGARGPAPTLSGLRSAGGGVPLPGGVRDFMEPRFGANFSHVRVHAGENAARLSRDLSARAFTVGNQIYFGKGAYQPDTQHGRELIAHELTHTIQQGASVQRDASASVKERSEPKAQRFGAGDVLGVLADYANNIPGYRMFTLVLGVNPINMSRVDRSAANVLRAVVEILPGGALITRALDAYGVFEKAGAWISQQLDTLGLSGAVIRKAIDRFIDSLSWTDIFDPGDVWRRAKAIFTDPIERLMRFVGSLVSGVLKLIKDAILLPLAKLAEGTPAWNLLCAVLGQNPITGEAVPRTAETLIGGFMKLIGQEEVWENIKKGNAVGRAWAWFQGALAAVRGFVSRIPSLFLDALHSLELEDLVLLPRAFARVAKTFGGFVGEFMSWAGNAVWNLLEIIFSVVAPGVLVYLQKAKAAFRTILKNPIGFLRNLIAAGKLGFNNFLTNFLTHLRTSLIGWLTGALSSAGVYIPQAFTLQEIVKFVLSVLGLTWQNIRQKLVRVIGETAVRAIETAFDIVVTLVREGPAAAWHKIVEQLTNLREMVIEQVMTFVRDRIIQAAVVKLLSMLNPVGAFIQAIIGIYNTIMFFIERMKQIAQVAASFIDSISNIASGVITAAATRVEQTMAGLLTLVISFLARLVGLGNVSEAVVNVVNRVRVPIDKALDRVVAWIVEQAKRLGRFVVRTAERLGIIRRPIRVGRESHTISVDTKAATRRITIESTPQNFGAWLNTWRPEVLVRAGQYKVRPEVNRHFGVIDGVLAKLVDTAAIPDALLEQIIGEIKEISMLTHLGSDAKEIMVDLEQGQVSNVRASLNSMLRQTNLASALSIRARTLVDTTSVPGSFTPQQIASVRSRYRGALGVGLGVYVDGNDVPQGIIAFNDLVVRAINDKDNNPVATDEQVVTICRAIYASIAGQMGGFSVVHAGTVSVGRDSTMQHHEEDEIRQFLAKGGIVKVGTRVAVGVSQNTICGLCVKRLSKEPAALTELEGQQRFQLKGKENVLFTPLRADLANDLLTVANQLASAINQL